jgi:hypothetical protein
MVKADGADPYMFNPPVVHPPLHQGQDRLLRMPAARA